MRKTRLWFATAAVAMVAAGAVVAGCGDDDDEGASGDDLGLITEGTLLVGSDIPFPPFEDNPSDPTGFDIDIVDAVAEDLDVEVEYKDTAFDTIFRDLAQGKFDMVASASTITEEREAEVDFSDPYFEAEQALVVPTDSDIASEEDLAGKTVGAQDGTTGETYANDETDAKSVRGFPEGPDAINAVQNGQVDATIIDIDPANAGVEESDGELEIAANIATGELYGFAFPEDNDALREAFNESLTELKDDGTLEDLYQEYFEKEVPDSVLDGTNELLK